MKKFLVLVIPCFLACIAITFKKNNTNNNSRGIDVADYNLGTSGTNYNIIYADTSNNIFLTLLRTKYNLNQVIANSITDLERVIKLTDWVNSKWQHNGNNSPNGQNADQILTGATNGGKYSCVGYGITLAGCLNAIGLKSRVLGLKRKEVETASCCAGHVCTEVYLNDIQKWVIADAQFDVIPTLNNVPLNAYELRQAIINNKDNLVLKGAANNRNSYLSFVGSYLYFFDIGINNSNNGTPTNFKSLMLVPIGVNTPSIFQINYSINQLGVFGTHYIGDFYKAP